MDFFRTPRQHLVARSQGAGCGGYGARALAACCKFVGPLVLVACSPTLDWREVRPAGSGALVLMPCKPTSQERSLSLAGQRVRLALFACTAGDQTWSLAFGDVADPARVGDVLQELVRAAGVNVAAAAAQALPLTVPGATPNTSSQMVTYRGQMPNGHAVQMQVAVFARGTRAFQATVLGGNLAVDPVQTFIESIRFAD